MVKIFYLQQHQTTLKRYRPCSELSLHTPSDNQKISIIQGTFSTYTIRQPKDIGHTGNFLYLHHQTTKRYRPYRELSLHTPSDNQKISAIQGTFSTYTIRQSKDIGHTGNLLYIHHQTIKRYRPYRELSLHTPSDNQKISAIQGTFSTYTIRQSKDIGHTGNFLYLHHQTTKRYRSYRELSLPTPSDNQKISAIQGTFSTYTIRQPKDIGHTGNFLYIHHQTTKRYRSYRELSLHTPSDTQEMSTTSGTGAHGTILRFNKHNSLDIKSQLIAKM